MTIEEAMVLSFSYYVAKDHLSDGNGMCYVAQHAAIPGCLGQGETIEAALEDLKVARRALFECFIEDGLEIPVPDVARPVAPMTTCNSTKSENAAVAEEPERLGVHVQWQQLVPATLD